MFNFQMYKKNRGGENGTDEKKQSLQEVNNRINEIYELLMTES